MLHWRFKILRRKNQIARIPNYLERDTRYTEPGVKAQERKRSRREHRVTISHVIHYNFGHRYAHTAID